jgi:hypothetical protein
MAKSPIKFPSSESSSEDDLPAHQSSEKDVSSDDWRYFDYSPLWSFEKEDLEEEEDKEEEEEDDDDADNEDVDDDSDDNHSVTYSSMVINSYQSHMHTYRTQTFHIKLLALC